MSRKRHILVVDDDAIILEQLSGILEDEGYDVSRASSAEAALSRLKKQDPDLVITDLKLPGDSGIRVLEETKALLPNCPVLVMIAHGSVETAVKAMRLGAFHYLQKPLGADAFLMEAAKALEHGELLEDRQALRARLSQEKGLGRILGESRGIAEIRRMIKRLADTDTAVLIIGETGTGKELVANALHYEGKSAGRPLVKVNCAALTETLLESELFGHEKGAFTGAEKRRTGRFELADGGTLFLDEIAEMGVHVQAKLLRVLEETTFERVGGEQSINVNFRLVSATNRDPEEAVEQEQLRQDLYYRLNTFRIEVPPLRERTDDIPILANGFLAAYAAKHESEATAISPEAMAVLCEYEWPGNVRELDHAIERAVVMCAGEAIEIGELPPPLHTVEGTDAGPPGEEVLDLKDVEKRVICRALEKTDGNKTRAAKKLGIYPSSLYKKMKRYGIPLEDEKRDR